MIGDVKKAEDKLIKLVGKTSAELIIKRVEKSELSSWTADRVITQVDQAVGGGDKCDELLDKGDKLVKIVGLLSTGPHTTTGSDFTKLVHDIVKGGRFAECLKKVYRNSNLEDDEIAFLEKKVKQQFISYLARKGMTVKKYKTIGAKMGSSLKVNRLKCGVTALMIVLIEYALTKDKNCSRPIKDSNPKSLEELVEEGDFSVFKSGEFSMQEFEQIAKFGSRTWRILNDKLTHIKIPNDARTIEPELFVDLENLQSVVVPSSVLSIGEEAFQLCKKLVTVILYHGLKHIKRHAFAGCKSLVQINIPESVLDINENAFFGCSQLQRINLPSCIKIIDEYTFASSGLIEVVIPEGVEKIKKKAFCDCSKLKKVYVPKSVKVIEEFAFRGCPQDMEITGNASRRIKNMIREQIGAK